MRGRESNYSAWIEKAENDFRNIENNLEAGTVPWDTVCFHPQQAAEKLLKAFLIYSGSQNLYPVSVHLRIGHPPHKENTLGLLVDDHEQKWMIGLEDHWLGRHPCKT